jgi:hypothetical protein
LKSVFACHSEPFAVMLSEASLFACPLRVNSAKNLSCAKSQCKEGFFVAFGSSESPSREFFDKLLGFWSRSAPACHPEGIRPGCPKHLTRKSLAHLTPRLGFFGSSL